MTVEPTFYVTIDNSDESVTRKTFVAQDSSRLCSAVRCFGWHCSIYALKYLWIAKKQLRNSLSHPNSLTLVYFFTSVDFSKIFSIVFRLFFLAWIKLQFSLNVTSENKKNQEHKISFLWRVCFINFASAVCLLSLPFLITNGDFT